MEGRRKEKFDRYAVQIVEQKVSEERNGHDVRFHYAVLSGKQLVGRTVTRRHALKRAHQHIHNIGPIGARKRK